jgi:hypothetical protein
MQLSTALPEGLQHYGIMYSTTRVIGTAQGQIHGHSDVGKTTERDPGSKHEAIPSEPQLGRPLATSFRHLLARNQLASNLQRGILPRASFSDTRFHLAPSTDLCPTASFSSSLSSEPQLGRPTSILLQPTTSCSKFENSHVRLHLDNNSILHHQRYLGHPFSSHPHGRANACATKGKKGRKDVE